MKYPIFLSLAAQREEAEAFFYYEQQAEGLGTVFLNEVETALVRIGANPEYNSYCDASRTIRDLALKRFPFLIIYEVFEDKVVVLNIYHTKKNH